MGRTFAVIEGIIAPAVRECGAWQLLQGAGTQYVLRTK